MKTFLSFILLMISACWSFAQFDLLTVKKAIGVKTNAPKAELHVKGNAIIETNLTVRGLSTVESNLNVNGAATFLGLLQGNTAGFDTLTITNYLFIGTLQVNQLVDLGAIAQMGLTGSNLFLAPSNWFAGNVTVGGTVSGTLALPSYVLTNNSTVPWFLTNKFSILGNGYSDASPPVFSVLSKPMPGITLHQGANTGVGVIVGSGDNATGDWYVNGGGIVSGHWFGATGFTLSDGGGSHTTLQVEQSTHLTITNAYGSFLQVDCPNTDNIRVENYGGFMLVGGINSSNCVTYNGGGLVVIDEQYGSDAITNYCNGNSILLTRAESATNVNGYSYIGSIASAIAGSALTVSNTAAFSSLAMCNAIHSTNVFNEVRGGSFGFLNGWNEGDDFGCLNAVNQSYGGSFAFATVFGTTNTLNNASGTSLSFLNAIAGSQNISSYVSESSLSMLFAYVSKDVSSIVENNSFLQSQLRECDNIAYTLDNSFFNLSGNTVTNVSLTAANSLIIGTLQSNTTNSFTDTIGVTTADGTSVFTPTNASIAGVGMTNGQVNAPLGYYQDHYSLNQSFTMFTNKQLYCVAGTNQVVTLIPAAANPWVIYRVTTTNGNGNFTITNSAADNATIRNGIDHTLKQIGVGEVGLFSDGANWQLASKARTVWPNAQFSCTTNIALTTAARAVSFNTTDFNNSQGIALLVGTNATWGHTSIWITNAGQYEFSPSIMQTYDGNHTITFWFKLNGANIPNSATASKGQNGSIRVITVPFLVSVTNTSQFEIWAISDDATGESFVTQAAGGAAPNDFPAAPSIICPIKRISDPRP